MKITKNPWHFCYVKNCSSAKLWGYIW